MCGHAEVVAQKDEFSDAPTAPLGYAAPSASLPVAQPLLFADRYELHGLLGRGGMGSVFKVVDTHDSTIRALKILHDRSAASDQGERFEREVKVLQRVSHPAIPRVFDSGVWRGQMYFVSELIDGEDLRSLIRTGGAMPWTDAAQIAASVADVLNVAHTHGVIHRDIKPHNIMRAADGSVKLLDFGVARQVGSDVKTLTGTGLLIGTPEYMAPEQFHGSRADGRSDIYSLGVTLFELVTGRLPFIADTPISLAIKHAQELPPEPRSLMGAIPHWMNRTILRCLEKDPAARFSSADELADALRKSQASGRRYAPLQGGDYIIEDDPDLDEWTMVIASRQPHAEWSGGMTLRFRGGYYRLDFVSNDEIRNFTLYHFKPWPESEVLRRLVEYEAPQPPAPPAGMLGRLRRLMGGSGNH